MIKAALFDVDGLVIVGRKKLFSERLSEEKSIPKEKIDEFFITKFKDCSMGRADLKEVIAPYIDKWGYNGTIEDLLGYWFNSESEKDEDVIREVELLRSKGVKCYIATRQEKYRMAFILNNVGLANHFDGVFCTCDIGYDKNEDQYWNFVFKKLNLRPEEIIFFDDRQQNIDAAKKVGIEAYFYPGINLLREKIRNL